MPVETNTPKKVTPPNPGEYLPAVIQKAVFTTGVKHPLTVFPIAIGASCGFVGWLFGMPVLYMAALGGMIIGPMWGIMQIFLRNNSISSQYVQKLNIRQKKYELYLRELIKIGLRECHAINGIEKYAEHGEEQLKNIQTKYANVKELLELKLRKNEITFGRFLGAAEQVTLSVLDNLKDVVGILKSAGSIKPLDIIKRLKSMESMTDITEDLAAQKKTLKERLDLWKKQLKKVNNLLTKNEDAMTEMEKISAAIAEWRTDGSFTDTDFESAITRLQELASRAYEYK